MKSLLVIAFAATLLAACSDRVPPPTTPTASRTPRPAATPSTVPSPPAEVPDFLQDVDIRALQIDRDAAVTNMTNLVIELGCTQCDGPTTGFARVYALPSGATQFDVLLTPEMLPLPQAGPEDQRYITGFGFAPDGSDLIAGVCVHGYCGGLGGPTPNAEVWLFRSEDGGITWTELQRLPRPEFVVGWLGPGVVLTSYFDTPGASSFTARPTGEAVIPPPGTPDAWPAVASDGKLLWHAGEGQLLYSNGSVYAGTRQAGVSFGRPLLGDNSDLLALSWSRGNRSDYYLAQLEPDGSVRRAYTADGWVNAEAWMSPVSGQRIFSSSSVPTERYAPAGDLPFVGALPAVIDLGSASVLPISQPFLEPPFLNGRNHIVAVQQGPLTRVMNTGDCLNVRDTPSMAAIVLVCLRDGVLLRDLGETLEADGVTWAHVVTPAGIEGWTAGQYLER